MLLSVKRPEDLGGTCFLRLMFLQGFPGVLLVVEHFLDSFLLEVNFIGWKLVSMARFMTGFLEIPIGFVQQGCIEFNSRYVKFISRMKESIKCPTAGRPYNAKQKFGHKWVNRIFFKFFVRRTHVILDASSIVLR